jgi:glycosyltransferase involved in cell wall biosynthesis
VCVNPLAPEEIARAIDSLVADSESAQRMGEAGRQAVMKRYNWAEEEKKLLVFYEQLRERVACEKF